MAIYKLVLPKMGESVSEATLTKWVKKVGEKVEEDDTLVEVATDKVDSEVPSPVNGILKEILFQENQVAQVGDVIAILEIEGDDEMKSEVPETETSVSEPTAPVVAKDEEMSEKMMTEIPGLENLASAPETSPADYSPAIYSNTNRFYSPLVKNIAHLEGITQDELDAIKGSGADGRLTKEDLLKFVHQRKKETLSPSPSDSLEIKNAQTPEVIEKVQNNGAQNPVKYTSEGSEIIEMDRMRKLIADHMVQSTQISPHVCSFVEADVTNMVLWRNKVKDAYKKREGENMTFTPMFIEAISKALRDFPMVNVSVDGYNIIKHKNINIGMAAALPSGNLIVPVIKNADQLSLVGLSKAVNDLANRSRNNKLKPDDTQNGTFTFSNIGAFGNIMGTPIINQPQAAILAVGTITKKPAVLETEYGDVIAIRHILYLSMSYDHRVIDGALGGSFLRRVGDYLEQWDINREI